MRWFTPSLTFALFLELVCLPSQMDTFGLTKGFRILSPLTLIGGAAGAGSLAGAFLASRHKHKSHRCNHHVKHIHYHPVHRIKYFHYVPIHHAWNDDGWHGNVGGSTDKWYSRWYHGYKLDSGYGWW
ncbi:uncharacterized protein LOC111260489 [Varroa jacobsoni]|uniref:uncharacterized protein LOC111260489 n=1 Tax=Varroa jacobsoni TaxID=62625 RepID=UPI000BF363DF|nr:uncharacterized protein LOC111260489 [Varroa jacobsoni]